MAGCWGNCDYKQLQKLRDNLAKLQEVDMDRFCREVSRELAARLLALVIPRTPVGRYKEPVDFVTRDGEHVHFTPHTGKVGGTLRRGWTARTEQEAENRAGSNNAKEYAMALPVTKSGDKYRIEVINPVHYASYVEFGHDKYNSRREYKGWQEGQYFLTLSEQDLRAQAPAHIEKKLEALLREVFDV